MAGLNPNDQLEYLLLDKRDIDSSINGALQIFQDFQDNDLWETFYKEFEGFTKKDFRRRTVIQLQKLRALFRRQGI